MTSSQNTVNLIRDKIRDKAEEFDILIKNFEWGIDLRKKEPNLEYDVFLGRRMPPANPYQSPNPQIIYTKTEQKNGSAITYVVFNDGEVDLKVNGIKIFSSRNIQNMNNSMAGSMQNVDHPLDS